jgi:hypothetical protein
MAARRTPSLLTPRSGKLCVALAALLLAGFDGIRPVRTPMVFLPGTQVGTVEAAESVQVCSQCHASAVAGHPVAIVGDWSGSMMAQSARDPIFYAALAVANKYRTSAGEYCIRCHSPTGWLAGHSEDFTGHALAGTDFDGVQCDYCHRAGDPMRADTSIPSVSSVPGYGNGMHAAQRYHLPKRGPRSNTLSPHVTLQDGFQRRSELCGVCHDVSNPFYAGDHLQQAPFEYSPIERTYSEWAESWYATQGESGTCQSCHMAATAGYACVYPSSYHTDLASHDLTGGNTFVPDILADFWPGVDTAALAAGRERAANTLERAAGLTVEAARTADSLFATIRVTNLTGHKLPTGYPEGRRMWLELVGVNGRGDTTIHSGVYDTSTASLLPDPQLKVYEAIRGITDSVASQSGLPAGASFHFVLNDTILFDNRIPPRGFTNAAYGARHARPVGVAYADGDYWDETRYSLPTETALVSVYLRYQTISRAYVEFLRDENVSNVFDWNAWGSRLFTAWDRHGRSRPVLMRSASIPIAPTAVEAERTGPGVTELLQNYPNPFNPTTILSFRLAEAGWVSLKVFDLAGRVVATLIEGRRPAGSHQMVFDARGLPSGIYMTLLTSGPVRSVKKMLVVK